jgi:hypothetical protein
MHMADSKANWDQVGEDFKALGRQVRQHYEQSRAEAATPKEGATGQPATDRPAVEPGPTGQAPPPADRRKVDEALQKLTESLDQAFSALGDAVRDPQVGEQTKKAASSLSEALNVTFAEVSERFRKK